MKHLQVGMEVTDLAAKLVAVLREAAETTPHDDVAKATGDALAIWLIEVGFQAGKFEELSGVFTAALCSTGEEVMTALQESYIASTGGRN